MTPVPVIALTAALAVSDLDEFKIKREAVFEFTQKPRVSRRGDCVEIAFETKGFCDVTVAIEEKGARLPVGPEGASHKRAPFSGRIIRHLASGVLGPSAPEPFQKNSRKQVIIWDGKDDRGDYVEGSEQVRIRVSLGLRPRFERTLFWSPKKRLHQAAPIMVPAEEGVYVYDGRVFDHVRLFDHEGRYVRTVYPFPADKLRQTSGLHWRGFPQSGEARPIGPGPFPPVPQRDGVWPARASGVSRANWRQPVLPVKQGFHQATLLSSGRNAGLDDTGLVGVDRWNNWHGAVWGNAASAMAVRHGRLALAQLKVNRLATDGSTGGLPLTGPDVWFPLKPKNRPRANPWNVPPRSAAFSPDGKTLYLTGYVKGIGQQASRDIVLINYYDWLPGLVRVDYEKGGKAEIFLGGMTRPDKGTGPKQFAAPSSVDVDAQRRIFVSDYANDRVQVFSPDGDLIESIRTKRPAKVQVNPKTGEIWVFSYFLPHEDVSRRDVSESAPHVTVFKSFDDPTPVRRLALPMFGRASRTVGLPWRTVVDFWADPITIWIAADWGYLDIMSRKRMKYTNIKVFALTPDGFKIKGDFDHDVRRAVRRVEAPEYHRQRLYVNPKDGTLYIGEGQTAAGKSFKQVVRVDPETGHVQLVDLPFDAEDMAFDPAGRAYLRTFYLVVRYDPETWREVPFDYGEARNKVTTSSGSDRREAVVTSAIRLPVAEAGLHHHGGMNVSVNGNLAIAVNNSTQTYTRRDIYDKPLAEIAEPYVPVLFPGRVRWGEVHIFDPFGRPVRLDAIPGLNRLDGIGIDKDNRLYAMATATRVLDGTTYVNGRTETLVKFDPARAKVLSPSNRAAVPLTQGTKPKRPPEFANGHIGAAWADGAAWFYGGLGFGGKNGGAHASGGCDCYNARFALDYFARSFAPETEHYSVAILDMNGNLITRIGQYGNVDDGVPIISDGGPPAPRSIGGDEVALMHGAYVATHTDRRLFIADPGNARIVGVRLDYHATERVALKDAKDLAKAP